MTDSANPTPSGDAQARLHEAFTRLRDDLSQTIVGQAALVERLLIALLADGHLLVEGAPGLAKTTAIRALASRLQADFARVQFTPDLLPADLTGTEVWRPQEGRFEFQAGPIFHPLLLADDREGLLVLKGEERLSVGFEARPEALSLIPFSRECWGVSCGGVRWPLEDVVLEYRDPYSVSNRLGDDMKVCVEVKSGLLGFYWEWGR